MDKWKASQLSRIFLMVGGFFLCMEAVGLFIKNDILLYGSFVFALMFFLMAVVFSKIALVYSKIEMRKMALEYSKIERRKLEKEYKRRK